MQWWSFELNVFQSLSQIWRPIPNRATHGKGPPRTGHVKNWILFEACSCGPICPTLGLFLWLCASTRTGQRARRAAAGGWTFVILSERRVSKFSILDKVSVQDPFVMRLCCFKNATRAFWTISPRPNAFKTPESGIPIGSVMMGIELFFKGGSPRQMTGSVQTIRKWESPWIRATRAVCGEKVPNFWMS
jgi:hypothetical protein